MILQEITADIATNGICDDLFSERNFNGIEHYGLILHPKLMVSWWISVPVSEPQLQPQCTWFALGIGHTNMLHVKWQKFNLSQVI